jgi:predicted kinase
MIYRGLQGSGKTTQAKMMQAMEPDRTIRVNRDDTRRRLFGSDDQDYYQCGKEILYRKESLVTEANRQSILAALKAGMDVIVDDTNLPVKRCRDLIRLAVSAGADWTVQEFDVPLEECLLRNANRTDKEPVPEEVIRRMYTQFYNPTLAKVPTDAPDVKAQDYSDLVPVGPHDPEKKDCYLYDLDGTVALMNGRSPYDYTRVSEDAVNQDVVTVIQAVGEAVDLIAMSGRKSECRADTEQWLRDNHIPHDALYMRAEGDDRADWKVKYDLFNAHVRDKYNVLGVFDDRLQVCRAWHAMGLTLFRVGDPDADF